MRAGCRRLHLVRHLGTGRRGARAARCSPPRRARGELHERGRRRRARPLPAQRHGAVAAQRSRCARGSATATRSTFRRCWTPRGGHRQVPVFDVERPPLPSARRHARAASTRGAAECGVAAPRDARRVRAQHRRESSRRRSPMPSHAGRPHRRRRRRDDPHRRRRRAERTALPAHRRPLGLPVLAGPVEATALGNVLVQARAHGLVTGLARSAPRPRRAHPRSATVRAARMTAYAAAFDWARRQVASGRLPTRGAGHRDRATAPWRSTRSARPAREPPASRTTTASSRSRSRWSASSRRARSNAGC